MTKSRRLGAAVPILAALAIMLLSQAYLINNEITKKPLTIEKLNERDTGYFYNLYLAGEPIKEGGVFIGDEGAQINLVAYLDPESDASRHFAEEIYPMLKKEYIETGAVKVYPKHYLTKDDLDRRSERHRKEKALDCVRMLAPEKLEAAYLDMLSNNTATGHYGIPEANFNECLAGKDSEEMLTGVSETEQFSIGRSNARFFIGVEGTISRKIEGIPPYALLKRQLNEIELSIGE